MIREKFQDKLNSLSQEAQFLSEERHRLIGQIQEIETRLTQLVGAIAEITMVLDSVDTNPASPAESNPPGLES